MIQQYVGHAHSSSNTGYLATKNRYTAVQSVYVLYGGSIIPPESTSCSWSVVLYVVYTRIPRNLIALPPLNFNTEYFVPGTSRSTKLLYCCL